MRADMSPRTYWTAVLPLAAALLAACGGPAAHPETPAAGASASASAELVPSASASTKAAFSCAIKPGAGLLPSQTAKPGRIVAGIAEIESATGLRSTSRSTSR
jgi:hypothetical protein